MVLIELPIVENMEVLAMENMEPQVDFGEPELLLGLLEDEELLAIRQSGLPLSV